MKTKTWMSAIGLMSLAAGSHGALIDESATATFGSAPKAAAMAVSKKEQGKGEWQLVAGRSIRDQLKEWALTAGWEFSWRTNKNWIVPASVEFSGTYDKALETVIQQLYAQGAPIQLHLWEGNRFAEVVDADVK